MIYSRRIGDARVSNLVELSAPTHDPHVLFNEIDPGQLDAALRRHESWLAPYHFVPLVWRLVITMQTWIIQIGDKIVLIDMGVGNNKKRLNPRIDYLNTTYLFWLESIGAAPDKVTHVINTHLHMDHVGWNTITTDKGSTPTFPNARYLMPRIDFDYFSAKRDQGDKGAHTLSLEDSILPVVEAGLADFVTGPLDLGDGISIEPMPGHSPGHMCVLLKSAGQSCVFSGDVFHTPLQIGEPDWSSRNDILPDEARKTRHAFIRRFADTGTTIMPHHFGKPYCGFIQRQGTGHVFRPAEFVP